MNRQFVVLMIWIVLPGVMVHGRGLPQALADTTAPNAAAVAGALEPVTMQVRDMDVVELLRLLAERAGVSVVISSSVRGTVTMFLRNVPVREAIERVLTVGGLASAWHDDMLTVMTPQEYEQLEGSPFRHQEQTTAIQVRHAQAGELAKLAQRLASPRGAVLVDAFSNQLVLTDRPDVVRKMTSLVESLDRPMAARLFRLNYALPEELAPRLRDMSTAGVGKVVADDQTRSVWVQDYPSVLERLERFVQSADRRREEVFIEARMLQVTLDEEHRMGVDWEALSRDASVRALQALPFPASAAVTATSSSAFSSIRVGTLEDDRVSALIRALESVGHIETLANPRLLVVDRQEAKILVGTKEAFVTSTVTIPSTGSTITSDSVQFVDVGVTLTVTPSISQDGYILMRIAPEVSAIDREVTTTDADGNIRSRVPIVRTQETDTTVIARDGETIILGGLIEERDVEETNAVPFLSRVPVVGNVFQNRYRLKRRNELIILLTPRIQSAGEESFGAQAHRRRLFREQE